VILHFAPEPSIGSRLQTLASQYTTADIKSNCDLQIDMTNMVGVESLSYDVVVAFDVLEHVPDFRIALEEVNRILAHDGHAILTVPQKDDLALTYEDANIATPRDRAIHFGEADHLRIFGDDFADIVESKGFSVTAVDESGFREQQQKKNVLCPPIRSENPLATNYRKVFFCKKLHDVPAQI